MPKFPPRQMCAAMGIFLGGHCWEDFHKPYNNNKNTFRWWRKTCLLPGKFNAKETKIYKVWLKICKFFLAVPALHRLKSDRNDLGPVTLNFSPQYIDLLCESWNIEDQQIKLLKWQIMFLRARIDSN